MTPQQLLMHLIERLSALEASAALSEDARNEIVYCKALAGRLWPILYPLEGTLEQCVEWIEKERALRGVQ